MNLTPPTIWRKVIGATLTVFSSFLVSSQASTLSEDFVSLAEDGQGNLYGVAPGTGTSAGLLRRSTDSGTTWAAVELAGAPITNTTAAEAFGSTVVAVGGASGTIYRSSNDGQDWFANEQFILFDGLSAIATDGNGNWLTVGDDGEPFAAASTDDGQNWTEVGLSSLSLPGLSSFTGVAWDETAGLWLMVGVAQNEGIAVTFNPDSGLVAEVSWPVTPPGPLTAVAADGEGNFLAVGEEGTLVFFSGLGTDTPTISEPDPGLSQDLHAVTRIPGKGFLAGGGDAVQVSVSAGAGEVLALETNGETGTIEDYLLPAGASLPLLAANGYSGEPILYLDPLVAFGDRAENAPSVSNTVSLANLGEGTLTVEEVNLLGDAPFSLGTIEVDGSSVTPEFDLTAGQEALATVSFAPTGTGSFSGQLEVVTTNEGTAAAELTGSGVPNPSFTTSFPTTEIVEGRAFTYNITVTDLNYEDEIVLSVSSGTLPEGLELTDNGSGEGTLSGVPAADSAGSYNFTLEASVDSTGGTAVQSITATVLTPPSLSLSGDLAFGNVATGTDATKTLTVSNTGQATMVVNAVTSSADPPFAVSPTSFGVAGGGSEEVTVTFSPTATGASSSTITVSTATVGQANEGAEGTGVDDPLATYLFAFGLTGADAAADADPDTDSKENLLEFAFGSDPASASSLPRMVASTVSASGSSYPALSFQHRQTDPDPTGSPFSVDGITYTVEGSTDLTQWNESVVVANDPSGLPTPETGYEWITFRLENIPLSTSGAKGFLRVEVSQEAGGS